MKSRNLFIHRCLAETAAGGLDNSHAAEMDKLIWVDEARSRLAIVKVCAAPSRANLHRKGRESYW